MRLAAAFVLALAVAGCTIPTSVSTVEEPVLPADVALEDEVPADMATPTPTSTLAPTPSPKPTPTPIPTPKPTARPEIAPIKIEGDGNEATSTFQLEEGLTIIRFNHQGEGYFGAWLLDAQGDRVSLAANSIGNTEGARAVRIEDAGNHLLNVESSGSWSFLLEQPRISTARAPGEYTGTGYEVAGPFQLGEGLARFKFNHKGEGYFGVWLLNADGSRAGLIANDTGTTEGSKALGLDGGIYYLNVEADSPWSISVN